MIIMINDNDDDSGCDDDNHDDNDNDDDSGCDDDNHDD